MNTFARQAILGIDNPAIGKFLSVDPLTASYPSWTPYAFAMNRVIDGVDLDGLEYAPAGKNDQGQEVYSDELNEGGQMVDLGENAYLYRRQVDGEYSYWASIDGGPWEQVQPTESSSAQFNIENKSQSNGIGLTSRLTGANPVGNVSMGLLRSQYAVRTHLLKPLYNPSDLSKIQAGFDGRHLIKEQTRRWMYFNPSAQYALRNAHLSDSYAGHLGAW